MLPLRARDLGAIALKGYSAFPKIPALRSDYLVSYPGHLLGEFYSSAEMQSVCLAALADWAIFNLSMATGLEEENFSIQTC